MSALRRIRRPSSFQLRVTQRLRHSWTHWSQRRTLRKLVRAEARLILLRLETDSQLLRIKELQSRSQALTHREQEAQESLSFRLLEHQPGQVQILPPVEEQREAAARLLGISTR